MEFFAWFFAIIIGLCLIAVGLYIGALALCVIIIVLDGFVEFLIKVFSFKFFGNTKLFIVLCLLPFIYGFLNHGKQRKK